MRGSSLEDVDHAAVVGQLAERTAGTLSRGGTPPPPRPARPQQMSTFDALRSRVDQLESALQAERTERLALQDRLRIQGEAQQRDNTLLQQLRNTVDELSMHVARLTTADLADTSSEIDTTSLPSLLERNRRRSNSSHQRSPRRRPSSSDFMLQQRGSTTTLVQTSGGAASTHSHSSSTSSSASHSPLSRSPRTITGTHTAYALSTLRGSRPHQLKKKKRVQSGIVFGLPLEMMRFSSSGVPTFVEQVLDRLEATALDTPFLFSSKVPQDMLAELVDDINAGDLDGTLEAIEDHGTLAALLKIYLVSLPDPLIPNAIQEQLQDAAHVSSTSLRNVMVLSILLQLPSENRNLFLRMIEFGLKLLSHSRQNGLTSPKLQSLFGALLLHKEEEGKARIYKKDPTVLNSKDAIEIYAEESDPACLLALVTAGHISSTSQGNQMSMLLSNFAEVHPYRCLDPKFSEDDGRPVLIASTPQRLFDLLLCKRKANALEIRRLLPRLVITYRYWAGTPEQFYDGLTTTLSECSDLGEDAEQKRWIANLVDAAVRILAVWTRQHFDTVVSNEEIATKIKQFIPRVLEQQLAVRSKRESSAGTMPPHVKYLWTCFLKKCNSKDRARSVKRDSSYIAGPFPGISMKARHFDLNILNAATIANQIALIDHHLFEDIPLEELECKRFTKLESAPKFFKMVNQTNHWANLLATEILNTQKPSARVTAIEHWIDIAKHLEKLQDFNGCLSVVGGLGNSSIARLKLTWSKVSRKSMRTFERLSKLSSGLRNYKALRDRLRFLSPPGVPYIGLISKDLVNIEEGNHTTLDGGLINVEKLSLLGKTFIQFLDWRSIPYELEMDVQLRGFLKQYTTLTEDEQYDASLKHEPRVT